MSGTVYECMFILDSNKYARDPNGVTGGLATMVEKCDGELLASRLWNEQKLAYPINGQRKGTYWLTYFRMEPGRVSEFSRECALNSHVLRQLVLKVEPRLVDALVAHARGEAAPAPEGASAEEKPAEEKPAEEKPAAEATTEA